MHSAEGVGGNETYVLKGEAFKKEELVRFSSISISF